MISMLISVAYGQASSSEDGLRIGPEVTAPKPTRRPAPEYSSEARSAGIQGSVLLELVVDERGLPTQIRVLRPLGYGLDEQAIKATKQWRFEPGLKDGKPVKVAANMEINFRLLGRNTEAAEELRAVYNRALGFLKGTAADRDTALKWFQEMAERNYPAAMYTYGKLLSDGEGFPPDPKKGDDLIRRAAQAKYGPAMFTLASSALKQKSSKAFKEAKEGMRDAAASGSSEAQYFLGFAYEHGNPDLGLRQDENTSREYYRLCAAAGDILCQYRLGDLLLNQPNAREHDIAQAIAWLELSADQGEPQAKMLADRSRTNLTPEQVKDVASLKKLLVRRN